MRALARCLLLALLLAVVAGFQPAFSDPVPERLSLQYVEQDGKAYWLADPVTRLPQSLRSAARFSDQPQRMLELGFVAPAGKAQFPAPSAAVSRDGDRVTLNLNAAGDGVALLVPREAGLRSVSMGDVTVPANGERLLIACGTPDCGAAQLVLDLSSAAPVNLLLITQRRGLPPEGAKLIKARPGWAVPSQRGDVTRLVATVSVPGR